MNKRGLSVIVTITLIIVIAITAIFLVWKAVSPLFEDVENQVTTATSCFNAKIAFVGTCSSSNGSVTVSNEGSSSIEAVKLFYYESSDEGAESISYDGGPNCEDIGPKERKKCTPSGFNVNPVRVQVAAIANGNVCDIESQEVICE